MSAHWEATTLRLTAKQARVLWSLVWYENERVESNLIDGRPKRKEWRPSLRAILRKLEGGK